MTRDEWNRDVDQYIKEMNSLVGKEPVRSPDVIGSWPQSHRLVTEEVIKNFAWNTGCNNPLYVDPEYAGKTRWGGVIAPPGRFVHYIAETGYLPQGRIIEGMNHLYGGTTYEYHDVIRPGDTFHIQDEFFGVTEKSVKEKPYRLLIMSSRRDYINQTGKTVVSATGNTVITCAYPENREPGDSTVYGKVAKPHYSKEELEAVHRHYEDYFAGKLTRGAKIRYWEDVEEGEKLTPIIKGPLDIVDVISFNCATGAMQGGGATKWDSVKNKKVLVDPDTGEYLSVGCFHYIDSIAQQMGFPNALTFAAQHEAYTSEIVTNWMGDDAFVKKLSHQQRRPSFQGDMAYVKGFVKKKYIKNEEHLIDIEMWTENQNGVKVCPSSATVRLVSREKT
jgi:acyl dehydratase